MCGEELGEVEYIDVVWCRGESGIRRDILDKRERVGIKAYLFYAGKRT